MWPNITPVILAGGSGMRLRPLTSKKHPKPFLKIGGQTLLKNTIQNVSHLKNCVIVCDETHASKALVSAQSVDGSMAHNVIAEPCARSTAPALAAFYLRDQDTVMAVMPSDHYFSVPPEFIIPDEGQINIIGVSPRAPSGRYGYIETDDQNAVLRFIEKPDKTTVKMLLKKDNMFWNTGVFLVRPRDFLALLKTHAPEIYVRAEQALEKGKMKDNIFYPDVEAYNLCPSIAVDYAVMEHVTNAMVVPYCGQWHDIGCWPDYLRVKLKTTLSFRQS